MYGRDGLYTGRRMYGGDTRVGGCMEGMVYTQVGGCMEGIQG